MEESRRERTGRDIKFNAAARLAGERQERGRNRREVCDAEQTDWPLRNSRGCQTVSRSRSAQCGFYTGPNKNITD